MAVDNGPVAHGFTVTWSIGIEEQFYLVAPLCIWLTPKRHLLKLLIGAAISAVIFRVVVYIAFPSHNLAPYILPFTRLDCLCAGGMLAVMWRDQTTFQKLRKVAPNVMVILSLLVAFMVYKNITGDLFATMYYWGHTLLSVFYFFVVLSVISWRPSIFRMSFLRAAGTISYGLYLFHPLFISLLFQLAGRPERVESFADALLAVSALLIAVSFCATIYILVERPIRQFGHSVTYSKPSHIRQVMIPTQA
jgi:peptidoglycan/LPS O-acetylase OafA/YrhL